MINLGRINIKKMLSTLKPNTKKKNKEKSLKDRENKIYHIEKNDDNKCWLTSKQQQLRV
jgi:hypothetical protein